MNTLFFNQLKLLYNVNKMYILHDNDEGVNNPQTEAYNCKYM